MIEINAAVAAGPVRFGVVGHKSRLEYTVMGDPVSLAAKLEKHAKRERARARAPRPKRCRSPATRDGSRPPLASCVLSVPSKAGTSPRTS